MYKVSTSCSKLVFPNCDLSLCLSELCRLFQSRLSCYLVIYIESPEASRNVSPSQSTPAAESEPGPSPRHAVSVIGCPRDNSVWDHFSYDADTDKSLCQVLVDKEGTSDATICGHTVSGKFTTNLKNHF